MWRSNSRKKTAGVEQSDSVKLRSKSTVNKSSVVSEQPRRGSNELSTTNTSPYPVKTSKVSTKSVASLFKKSKTPSTKEENETTQGNFIRFSNPLRNTLPNLRITRKVYPPGAGSSRNSTSESRYGQEKGKSLQGNTSGHGKAEANDARDAFIDYDDENDDDDFSVARFRRAQSLRVSDLIQRFDRSKQIVSTPLGDVDKTVDVSDKGISGTSSSKENGLEYFPQESNTLNNTTPVTGISTTINHSANYARSESSNTITTNKVLTTNSTSSFTTSTTTITSTSTTATVAATCNAIFTNKNVTGATQKYQKTRNVTVESTRTPSPSPKALDTKVAKKAALFTKLTNRPKVTNTNNSGANVSKSKTPIDNTKVKNTSISSTSSFTPEACVKDKRAAATSKETSASSNVKSKRHLFENSNPKRASIKGKNASNGSNKSPIQPKSTTKDPTNSSGIVKTKEVITTNAPNKSSSLVKVENNNDACDTLQATGEKLVTNIETSPTSVSKLTQLSVGEDQTKLQADSLGQNTKPGPDSINNEAVDKYQMVESADCFVEKSDFERQQDKAVDKMKGALPSESILYNSCEKKVSLDNIPKTLEKDLCNTSVTDMSPNPIATSLSDNAKSNPFVQDSPSLIRVSQTDSNSSPTSTSMHQTISNSIPTQLDLIQASSKNSPAKMNLDSSPTYMAFNDSPAQVSSNNNFTQMSSLTNSPTLMSSTSSFTLMSADSSPAQVSLNSRSTQASSNSSPAQMSSKNSPAQMSPTGNPVQVSAKCSPTQMNSSNSSPAQMSSTGSPVQVSANCDLTQTEASQSSLSCDLTLTGVHVLDSTSPMNQSLTDVSQTDSSKTSSHTAPGDSSSSSVKSECPESNAESTSGSDKTTHQTGAGDRINQALAALKTELASLREQDLAILRQLIAISSAIQRVRRAKALRISKSLSFSSSLLHPTPSYHHKDHYLYQPPHQQSQKYLAASSSNVFHTQHNNNNNSNNRLVDLSNNSHDSGGISISSSCSGSLSSVGFKPFPQRPSLLLYNRVNQSALSVSGSGSYTTGSMLSSTESPSTSGGVGSVGHSPKAPLHSSMGSLTVVRRQNSTPTTAETKRFNWQNDCRMRSSTESSLSSLDFTSELSSPNEMEESYTSLDSLFASAPAIAQTSLHARSSSLALFHPILRMPQLKFEADVTNLDSQSCEEILWRNVRLWKMSGQQNSGFTGLVTCLH